MKRMKYLLLGSAAGLAVAGGAQAADLPVKARPVQYVKICTLYGEGFYYIPGTDTCIKLGGYVRADYGWNVKGARTPQYTGTGGAQDRTVSPYSTRHRAHWDVDVRTQTAYGTLRTFTGMHFQNENGGDTFNVQRAFIQWAGFTFGHAQSFQDTWAINASWHYAQQQDNSDTGANGVNQIAYTWELGGGMSLTVGADEVRRKSLTNLSIKTAIQAGREPTSSFAGQRWPDPHLSFRVDQAWGYWASSVVGHDVSATYDQCGGAIITPCGHPDDEVGWAVQTGAEFKLNFINPGDRFGWGVRYAQGASGFGGGSNLNSPDLFGNSDVVGTLGSIAAGQQTDGVFINGNNIELTTTWTVQGGFEHYWTPALKTSFTAAYSQVLYNDTAKGYFATNVCPAGAQSRFSNIANCDPDWGFFQGGVRTQWNVTKAFYLGLDVFYTRVFTAFKGSTVDLAPDPIIGARPAGTYELKDDGIIGAIFRAQSRW